MTQVTEAFVFQRLSVCSSCNPIRNFPEFLGIMTLGSETAEAIISTSVRTISPLATPAWRVTTIQAIDNAPSKVITSECTRSRLWAPKGDELESFFMKKSPSFSTTWISLLPVFFLLASASVGFAKAQKKSTESGQEKPEAILSAAKKFADAKAWGVQAHVNADKDMKI